MTVPYLNPVKLEDRLLYLYLFGKLHEIDRPVNQVQEHKLYFLSQWEAINDKGILTCIRFMREKRGPVAPHLYDLERYYTKTKLLDVFDVQYYDMPQKLLSISKEGFKIFNELKDFFKEESRYLKYMDTAISKFGKETGWDMRQYVYKIEINGVRIEDYPIKSDIPTIPDTPSWQWSIPDGWKYTIQYLLTPGNYELLEKISAENCSEPFTTWQGAR